MAAKNESEIWYVLPITPRTTVALKQGTAPFVWELYIDGSYVGDLHPTADAVRWIANLPKREP